MRPWAVIGGLLAAAAVAGEARPPEKAFDAVIVPLVSFNTDQGFGGGAVAGAYFYAPGFHPYRHAIALQGFWTAGGVQNHYLRYDGPRLLGPFRLEARLEYRRELYAPFFGAGNLSAPDFAGDPRDPRFNYDRFSPGGWLRLRGRPWGQTSPFELYGGLGYRSTVVRAREDSVLAQLRPTGFEGGPTSQLLAGGVWDTRDLDGDPTAGALDELSFRGSARGVASRYSYLGVTAVDRRFFPFGDRLVFAQRVMFDALFGDVPFFEWTNLGGLAYADGVGGQSSVRGVPRNRFGGNFKLVSNSELRVHVHQVQFWKAPVRFGVVGFFDVGRVWHPGVDDGGWADWHPGIGFGLRAARREAVLRADLGFSTETWRPGAYMTFGHMF